MFRADCSHEPFVIQQVQGHLSDADLEAVEEYMRTTVGKTVYAIIDCRGAERPDSTGRARLAELMKRYAGGGTGVSALVFSNKVVAGAMTALRWIVPSTNPESYVSSAAEGLQFLEAHALKKGLVIPADFRRRVLLLDSAARSSA